MGRGKKTDAILGIILNPKLQTSAEQTKSVEEVWSYLQKGVRVDVTKDGLKPPGSPLAAMVGSGQITGSGGGGDMLATNMGVPDSKDADTMTTTPNTEAITLQAIEDQAVEHISMVNEDQEEANKSAPWGITLELLQTQFSKHLKRRRDGFRRRKYHFKTDLSSIRHCALASTIVEIKAEQSAERSRESTKQIEESEEW